MDICIYQVNMARDKKNYAFMSLDKIEHFTGSAELDATCYDKVYEATVDCKDLEDVYDLFNLRHPFDFYGHSLSVSDVVEVKDTSGVPELVGRIRFYNSSTAFEECLYADEARFKEDIEEARFVGRCIDIDDLRGQHVPYTEKGFYFCDSVGFKKIEFDHKKTQPFKGPETVQVLIVEPDKPPYPAQIATDFRQMQRVIGGHIEAASPFPGENVAIVCNEEGKLRGLPFNRSVCEPTGAVVDYMVGTFFIVGTGEEDFCSLTEEQVSRFSDMLRDPASPIRVGEPQAPLEDVINKCESMRSEPSANSKNPTLKLDNCL